MCVRGRRRRAYVRALIVNDEQDGPAGVCRTVAIQSPQAEPVTLTYTADFAPVPCRLVLPPGESAAEPVTLAAVDQRPDSQNIVARFIVTIS